MNIHSHQQNIRSTSLPIQSNPWAENSLSFVVLFCVFLITNELFFHMSTGNSFFSCLFMTLVHFCIDLYCSFYFYILLYSGYQFTGSFCFENSPIQWLNPFTFFIVYVDKCNILILKHTYLLFFINSENPNYPQVNVGNPLNNCHN